MYQVNVFFNQFIYAIVYNCSSYNDAVDERFRQINKWFKIFLEKGKEPAEIFDLLKVEIKQQEGSDED